MQTATATKPTAKPPESTRPVTRQVPTKQRQPLSPGKQYALDILVLLAVSAAIFFFRLNSFGIIDPGDGYYTEGAREMVESGNYLVPQLNGQVYFSKPILMFWLIAGAYHVFGINEFAGRFWSAAFATALVAVTYALTRALAGRSAGYIAALLVATTPMIVQFAHLSLIDMTFSALLGIALASVIMSVFLGRKQWLPAFYISLALSVLCKGPAGLVFFALGAALFLIARRPSRERFFELLKSLQLLWGLPLLAVIAVPWFCAVGAATNWLWPKVFFLFENAARFVGATNYHKSAPWYYIPVLGYAFAPWVLFIPHSIKAVVRDEWTEIDGAQRDGIIFLSCWAAATFGIFSFCGTQIAYYILPVLAPCAVLVGILFDRWGNKTRAALTPALFRHVCLALAVAAPFGALAGGIALLVAFKNVPAVVTTLGIAACAVCWFGLTVQYGLLRSDRVRACINALLCTFALVTALAAPAVFDITYRFMQIDLYKITMEAKKRTGMVVVFRSFNPSVMFYLERPINSVFNEKKFKPNQNATQPIFVISQQNDAQRLIDRYPQNVQILEKEGSWCLLLASHMTLREQETLETLYTYCMDDLVRQKDKYGPATVPFAAGMSPKHNHFQKWL